MSAFNKECIGYIRNRVIEPIPNSVLLPSSLIFMAAFLCQGKKNRVAYCIISFMTCQQYFYGQLQLHWKKNLTMTKLKKTAADFIQYSVVFSVSNVDCFEKENFGQKHLENDNFAGPGQKSRINKCVIKTARGVFFKRRNVSLYYRLVVRYYFQWKDTFAHMGPISGKLLSKSLFPYNQQQKAG